MKKIILIGSGGHSKVILDIIASLNNFEVEAILDDKFNESYSCEGIHYGPIYNIDRLSSVSDVQVVITIGNNKTRKQIYDRLDLPDDQYATIIHPSVIIGSNVEFGRGTVVMPGAIINANTFIGDHCIINTASVIEHDTVVGPFSHISPKVALAGNVKVKEGSHIGVGASVIPSILIGEWSLIGAGAVVVKDIPDHCTAVGIPAKPIKFHKNELTITR